MNPPKDKLSPKSRLQVNLSLEAYDGYDGPNPSLELNGLVATSITNYDRRVTFE